jgi:hypothetical protein
MCMGVLGASTLSGAPVVQWPCNGSPDQNWVFNASTHRFTDVNSGMCLSEQAPTAQVVQLPCNTSTEQQWV